MISCSVKLAKINSTIKGYHFYFKSSNFGEILKCVLEPANKHSRNTIRVLSTKRETIGHVPEILAKILALEKTKETILSSQAEVTGSPRDAPEGKWVLGEGVEIPCTYKVYGRIDQKGLNNFFNTLQLSILYRNINRKALKRLLFFNSVVFEQHILIISPGAYIRVGLKAR